MCSTRGDRAGTAEVGELGHAIDELARLVKAEDAGEEEVAAHLARVWAMVTDLDPELARRVARYTS